LQPIHKNARSCRPDLDRHSCSGRRWRRDLRYSPGREAATAQDKNKQQKNKRDQESHTDSQPLFEPGWACSFGAAHGAIIPCLVWNANQPAVFHFPFESCSVLTSNLGAIGWRHQTAKDERENLDHGTAGVLATANVLTGFGISPSKEFCVLTRCSSAAMISWPTHPGPLRLDGFSI
jgi:hypothetical protein